MLEFFNAMITGPVLPATILAGMMMAWSLFALVGVLDLDLPSDLDLDLDLDLDVDVSDVSVASTGVGYAALKWLNLGRVPLMIWGCVLAIAFWAISLASWLFVESRFFEASPSILWTVLLSAKSLILAILATKFITRPMQRWFVVEKITARNLVGQECTISSLEATPDFGQVKYKTEGAPLLLNVRTDGEHLAKGTQVWITHYDAKKRVYIVTPTGTNEQ